MSELGIAPEALQDGFIDGITTYLTDKAFDKLYDNLEREKITKSLGEFVGDRAIVTPWQDFMEVTDSITGAEPKASPNTPGALIMNVKIKGEANRAFLHDIFESTFNGISGEDMPRIREDGKSLTIRNLRYADISSIGRLGTATMRKEFADTLGPNIHLVQTGKIGEIESTSVVDHLPTELLDRINHNKQAFGKRADDTLLSTGNIGLIGLAARQVLGDSELAIQRPRRNRPKIEKGVILLSNGADVPTSQVTMRETLKGQALDVFDEFAEPYRERKFIKAGKEIWNILSDFGISDGVGSFVRAVSTVSWASGVSLKNMALNKHRLHAIQNNHK